MKPTVNNSDFLNDLTVEPLTKNNWQKFEKLFGEKGACGNCWCMYFRLPMTEFVEGKHDQVNKQKKKDLVWAGKPAGILCSTKVKQ